MKPERALLSLWDKTGVRDFAEALARHGIEIIATAGTAQLLNQHGIRAIEVSAFTGAPEILGGRVKTLHPKIFGGILAYRQPASETALTPIDIVAVSLYPFEEKRTQGLTAKELIELIDIGGVSLLRAAAKNWEHVAAIPDAQFFPQIIAELDASGTISPETRKALAAETFIRVAHYDAVIAEYFRTIAQSPVFGRFLTPSYIQTLKLRYGENPHQQGYYYQPVLPALQFTQLWGKELSYNNLLDIDATLALLQEFDQPVCTIIKHNTPCGVAQDDDQLTAFTRAYESDATSAFGGIIGFNRRLELPAAAAISKIFFEVIIVPDISDEALAVLKARKNLRVVQFQGRLPSHLLRSALAGVLIQTADVEPEDTGCWRPVSRRTPSSQEQSDLEFAWRVAKFVRSNAIVLARNQQTVGIGAGQMSRVDSTELAIRKARARAPGAVMASDGFFPFRDSIDLAAQAGITAVIEPGGSVRDAEVIAAADEHNLALIFTGRRHFRH